MKKTQAEFDEQMKVDRAAADIKNSAVQAAHREKSLNVQLNTKKIRVLVTWIFIIILIRFIFWAYTGLTVLLTI
jgi:hypothetical protein